MEKVEVRLSPELIEKLIEDKSLWDPREKYLHNKNPVKYPHPAKSTLVSRAIAAYLEMKERV